MPLIDDAEFAQSDIFLDHRLEEIMFRWDHSARRRVQRFYGSSSESLVGEDSGLYADALRWGERLSENQYFSPARQFAAEAHEGQRFGTHQSYLFHLDSLASAVRTQGLPDHVESAAYLHGVLTEGHDVRETDMRARFPEKRWYVWFSRSLAPRGSVYGSLLSRSARQVRMRCASNFSTVSPTVRAHPTRPRRRPSAPDTARSCPCFGASSTGWASTTFTGLASKAFWR
jgi:HD domain-containing protein